MRIFDRIIVYMIIIGLALLTASFKWPVKDGKITSTFCESRGDHFHDGVDMISRDNIVYPVKAGRLLYMWDRSVFPLEKYPGGGNYKVLSHEDSVYSIYMHLADGLNDKIIYRQTDQIGRIGNTGHSVASHLHFTVYDKKKNSTVNPFTIMPPVSDVKAPEIFNLFFKINDRYIMVRNNADIRLTKHYPLLIRIIDSIEKNERLGVYSLKVLFNGTEALNVVFGELSGSGRGMLVSDRDFSGLFDEEGYYKISGLTFQQGPNSIDVTASDFNGNKASKKFTLNVNLDITQQGRTD